MGKHRKNMGKAWETAETSRILKGKSPTTAV